MAELTERRVRVARAGAETAAPSASHQAFRILQVAFVIAPTIAGLDKFFMVLQDWQQYLAPLVTQFVPGQTFMYIVGAVEIAAGLLVAAKPKWGGYVVALWMGAIIANLVLASVTTPYRYWDIALRDLGLMLGALALARLARGHERGEHARATSRPAGATAL